jgi:hypothetical protein
MPAPPAIYREEQRLGWWQLAQFGVGYMVCVAIWCALKKTEMHASSWVAIGFVLIVGLAAATLMKMTTQVTPACIDVRLGWFPFLWRAINPASVLVVEVVSVRPIRDYGGWGNRLGRDGERAILARGDRGVRIHLAGGGRLLIGSQRPEELARAIDSLITRVA